MGATLLSFSRLPAPLLFFFYLFLAALGPWGCMRALSSCGKRRPLTATERRPPITVASPVAEHGLQGAPAPAVGARGL